MAAICGRLLWVCCTDQPSECREATKEGGEAWQQQEVSRTVIQPMLFYFSIPK